MLNFPGLVEGQINITPDEGGFFEEGIRLDLFNPNFGISGFYSLVGLISMTVFSLLIVVWLVVIGIGAFQIISSQGDEQKIQSGYKNVKNVFVGITIGMLFFIALSLVGTFLGFGNVYQWADKLAICELGESSIPAQRDDIFKFQFEEKTDIPEGAGIKCSSTFGWYYEGQVLY
ncbi:MAG TPA: hypothetical protein ENI23_10705 [bacterium]|nr:hypothetical protein [bacterium]